MVALLKTTQIQEPSSATVNLALGSDGTMTTGANMTVTGTAVMSSPYTMRNKIINGAMTVDQRNAGASVTPTSDFQYTLDRWQARLSVTSKFSVQQNAASVTPPAGYSNYLGVTSLSAYSVAAGDFFGIQQRIEGFNVADLAWGTASAQTITISFWVRSSLTGTFGGTLSNSAGNRTYPFSFTISSANTWEQKTVTITGDTSGTWVTNNGTGIQITFGLGVGATYSGTAGSWSSNTYVSATGAQSVVGTNGATFYITGVQLERGTVATPFEQRLYGHELSLCQRYCFVIPKNTFMGTTGQCYGVNVAQGAIPLPVSMRSAPTLTAVSDFTGFNVYTSTATTSQMTVFAAAASATTELFFWNMNAGSVLTAGNATLVQKSPTNVPLIFSSEL